MASTQSSNDFLTDGYGMNRNGHGTNERRHGGRGIGTSLLWLAFMTLAGCGDAPRSGGEIASNPPPGSAAATTSASTPAPASSSPAQTTPSTQPVPSTDDKDALARVDALSHQYLRDACDQHPDFKTRVEAVTASKKQPVWLKNCTDGVQTPAFIADVAHAHLAVFGTCKPHDCEDNQALLVYDGDHLYGASITANGPEKRIQWFTVDPGIEGLLPELVRMASAQ